MVVEGEKHACAVVNNNKDVYCWGQGVLPISAFYKHNEC
jgi:hypothetical protein